jgi:3-oxoadipate enol-lactonase
MTAPAPNRTRFARRAHSRVAYDPGVDSAPSRKRPVVVLLHDLLADRSVWYPLRGTLIPDVRVVVPDARGHGASPTLANQWYTVAELATDILAVLDAEELSAVHLVGHGLGGTTALDVALRFPYRVTTLTLIDPSLQTLATDARDELARDDLQHLRANDRAAADTAYKQLFDRALDTYWLPRRGSAWRQALTKPQTGAMRRHAPALAALLPALEAYSVDVAAIRGLPCPTLIVVSDSASRLDRAACTRLAELLPQARLETHSTIDADAQSATLVADDLRRLVREFIAGTSD